jgi:hypothetical protein
MENSISIRSTRKKDREKKRESGGRNAMISSDNGVEILLYFTTLSHNCTDIWNKKFTTPSRDNASTVIYFGPAKDWRSRLFFFIEGIFTCECMRAVMH